MLPPSFTKVTGWWFGTFFIFPYIGNNHPNWLSYFSEGWPNHQPGNFTMFQCFFPTFPMSFVQNLQKWGSTPPLPGARHRGHVDFLQRSRLGGGPSRAGRRLWIDHGYVQWTGWTENRNRKHPETIYFSHEIYMKYGAVRFQFSLQPIQWWRFWDCYLDLFGSW